MKKLTSFALAFALCTACAVSALAADATSGTTNPTSGATEITTSIKPLRISFSTKGENSTRGTASTRGTPPATKNVGADSISARARLRQDKPPRAHIECAPTDFVFNIGLAGSGRYNKKRVCDILDVTDSWCAVQDSNL